MRGFVSFVSGEREGARDRVIRKCSKTEREGDPRKALDLTIDKTPADKTDKTGCS